MSFTQACNFIYHKKIQFFCEVNLHLINKCVHIAQVFCSGEKKVSPSRIDSFSVITPSSGGRLASHRNSHRDHIAQFPSGNHFSLSSNSSSSLMLVAATKVFLLFTTTSNTIPYRMGTELYSSC